MNEVLLLFVADWTAHCKVAYSVLSSVRYINEVHITCFILHGVLVGPVLRL